MADCVFCKIVAGELPSRTIWEDDKFKAFLDIFPKIPGQAVLISKEHIPSDIFQLPDDRISEFFLAAKKVAGTMKNALGVERIAQRMEGLEVAHAHLKLYPVYSVEDYGEKSNQAPKRMADEELDKLFIKFEKGR